MVASQADCLFHYKMFRPTHYVPIHWSWATLCMKKVLKHTYILGSALGNTSDRIQQLQLLLEKYGYELWIHNNITCL